MTAPGAREAGGSATMTMTVREGMVRWTRAGRGGREWEGPNGIKDGAGGRAAMQAADNGFEQAADDEFSRALQSVDRGTARALSYSRARRSEADTQSMSLRDERKRQTLVARTLSTDVRRAHGQYGSLGVQRAQGVWEMGSEGV